MKINEQVRGENFKKKNSQQLGKVAALRYVRMV